MLVMGASSSLAQIRYFITTSRLAFTSAAPLETIKAQSTSMRGVLDATNRTFAFRVDNQSFKGFNSALQREHFNENYLESDQFPESTFSGKIIDDIDFTKPGTYIVRAKGMLTLRGVARERIIRSTVIVTKELLIIKADFNVLLDDHNIRIPRIVYQKIAPEIQINMNAELALPATKGK
jgi:polyisoprenoid-binding protein YceI